MPSWLPGYADVAAKGPEHPLHIIPDSVSADQGVFDSAQRARPGLVVQRALVGLPVQQVRGTHDCINVVIDTETPPFDFCAAFCSSRDAYVTGFPPLQAILRVLTRKEAEDRITPPECIGFLLLLFSLRNGLDTVTLEHSSFSRGRKQQETWHDWIARTFDTELPKIEGGFRRLVRGVPSAKERSKRHLDCIQGLELCRAQFIETTDGYLGLARQETRADDTVAILKGYNAPVVVRKEEGQHSSIGACYELGLMKGEARGFLDTRQAEVAAMEIK
jgi:hypothetical protein